MKGILIKAISGFYYVQSDNNLYECKARGTFRNKGESPVVGDTVEFTAHEDGKGIIEKICIRKNCLKRPLIANIDKLFIVSSFTTPAPNALLIDRLTAIAEYHGIEAIIVFNKCDLGDFSPWEKIYSNSGFKTVVCSATTGEGVDVIRKELEGCVSAFTGNSGVGKSSLLNLLFPELSLATGEVSEKLGRGRHTTRHTELFAHIYGGFVADTPGFSSLETEKLGIDFKEKLALCFPDFSQFLGECRFTSCTHVCEKGCAVCGAVSDGKIEKTRHESFITLFNEVKDLKSWN